MLFLGVDIGTTHCKAGVFDAAGRVISIAHRPTPAQTTPDQRTIYDPQALWQATVSLIREVAREGIAAVGVASMAETGLLLDRATGAARSAFLPWFDPASRPQAEYLRSAFDPLERFAKSGIRASFKCSLARLLWLREQARVSFDGGVWLSAADYIVYRLTGSLATDFSLAGRTYAFDILRRRWDTELLDALGFPHDIFPAALQSGTAAGVVTASDSGLPPGIPVTVAGHDHVCAALAVGAVRPGVVFDSMGTAETLVGALESLQLDAQTWASGLSYGCHVMADRYYWMGGISASGGSVEWLRAALNDPPLTYEQVADLAAAVGDEPTGILYYPYLSGSGIPRPDPSAAAALIGVRAAHQRGHLVRAALEGVAYEFETIRRAAEAASGHPIAVITAVGGGTRSRAWMQIKADVTGCRFDVCALPEATLLGAALSARRCAGQGDQPLNLMDGGYESFLPDAARHRQYRRIYEEGYLALQAPLRAYYEAGACLQTRPNQEGTEQKSP